MEEILKLENTKEGNLFGHKRAYRWMTGTNTDARKANVTLVYTRIFTKKQCNEI
jgi:hypothetical protein